MDAEEYAIWFAAQKTNTYYYINHGEKWYWWDVEFEEWNRVYFNEIESAISKMCLEAKKHLVSVGKHKEALQVTKISFIKAIERQLRQYMSMEGFELTGVERSRFIPKGGQHPKPIPLNL